MSFQLQCSLRDLHSRSTPPVIGSQLLEKKFCGFLHITGLSPSAFKERVLVWGMVLVESEFCGSSVFLTSSVELETTFPLIVVAHVEGSIEHTDFSSSHSTVSVLNCHVWKCKGTSLFANRAQNIHRCTSRCGLTLYFEVVVALWDCGSPRRRTHGRAPHEHIPGGCCLMREKRLSAVPLGFGKRSLLDEQTSGSHAQP